MTWGADIQLIFLSISSLCLSNFASNNLVLFHRRVIHWLFTSFKSFEKSWNLETLKRFLIAKCDLAAQMSFYLLVFLTQFIGPLCSFAKKNIFCLFIPTNPCKCTARLTYLKKYFQWNQMQSGQAAEGLHFP